MSRAALRHLALAALPLCALAYSSAGAPNTEPSPAEPATRPAVEGDDALVPRDVYLRDAALAAGRTRAGIVALFGRPDSTSARAVANRHDPTQTDTIAILHYADARYVLYLVTGGGELLELADIGGDRHLRHTRPGIGSPVDSLVAWLGEPSRRRSDALEYECLSCEVPQPVTFHLDGGRVDRIRFDFYVD